MLTLKEPIQLHIGQGLVSGAEAFGQRIIGNYGLLRSHYAAEDLLHLMTASTELPEDLGGMTTLVSQQSLLNTQNVTMDVVNNVVNRILLDGTTQFTYQDQVYITSVLNQLGINNLQQFMEQVRQLRTENETTLHLTKAYQSELKTLLLKELQGEETPALPLPRQEEEQEELIAPDPRVEMSLSVLNRLDTQNLFETVHKFQRRWDVGVNQFQNNEFRLAEQLRFSNQIRLTELKQQVYQQPQLHLLHHLNQFETSLVQEEPRTEEEVLSQAAAAALVNAVDQSVVEVLNRPQIWENQWLHLHQAMYQSAELTLKRFELYHTNPVVLPQTADSPLLPPENHYLRELREYQNLYQSVYPRAAEFGRAVGVPPMTRLLMTHLTHVQEGDEITEQVGERHSTLLLQSRAVLQKLLQSQNVLRVRDYRTETERLLRDHDFRTELTYAAVPAAEEEAQQVPPYVIHKEGTAELPQKLERAEIPPAPMMPEPMPLTLQEAEEKAPDVLVEQMNRIDQHNRTMMQILHQQMEQKTTPVLRQPDMQRTMQDALRALDDPESVLQDLEDQTDLQLIHDTYTAEESVLLEQADPVTRDLYEKILLFQRNPQAAVEMGLVQPASMGGLIAALKRAELPEGAPEDGDELIRAVQKMTPAQTTELLEQFQQPTVSQPKQEVLPPEVMEELVHRATTDQSAQEFLELLELQTVQQHRTETRGETLEVHEVLRQMQETQVQRHREETMLEAQEARSLIYRQTDQKTTEELLEELQQQTGLTRLEHRILEQDTLEVLDQVRQPVNLRRQVEKIVRTPDTINFIHKQATTDMTEELLEKIEEKKTSSKVQHETTEQFRQMTSHETDLVQQEHQVVVQTQEDITKLVNQTLSRQMRTISDQVYRQMEKRLQAERSRRGRL